MATISTAKRSPRKTWTVADLYHRFGPIPFERIRQNPSPGSGTVDDVVRLNDHEDRLSQNWSTVSWWKEDVGLQESMIAVKIGSLFSAFVEPRGLGLVAGADGTIQLDINLVRIPDVSFISWERVPGGEVPQEPVPLLVPDLAVEVINLANTRKEMDEKLQEYFDKGVRLVWYVRPRSRVVDVYSGPDHFVRLTASMRLDGGEVLPGLSVQVGELFESPKRPTANGQRKKNEPRPGQKKGPRHCSR